MHRKRSRENKSNSIMEEVKYKECTKAHSYMEGNRDGCQEFLGDEKTSGSTCKICNCHRNFHRRVEPPTVVYRWCCKVHDRQPKNSVDGCQEFMLPPGVSQDAPFDKLYCIVCGCHRNFHHRQERYD